MQALAGKRDWADCNSPFFVQKNDVFSGSGVKATPHSPRLAPLHVICLHIFRHSTQIFLAGRQPACVKFMHSDEKSNCVSDAQGLCGVALYNFFPCVSLTVPVKMLIVCKHRTSFIVMGWFVCLVIFPNICVFSYFS